MKIEKDETKLKFGNPQNSAKLIQSHFADDQMSNAAKSAQYHFPFLIWATNHSNTFQMPPFLPHSEQSPIWNEGENHKVFWMKNYGEKYSKEV